jgi:sporulation protein YlmC with PRC-barrel domain
MRRNLSLTTALLLGLAAPAAGFAQEVEPKAVAPSPVMPWFSIGDPPPGPGFAAEEAIGRIVVDAEGYEVGRISDLITNSRTGRIEQVVVTRDGFLGFGGSKITMDWQGLEMDEAGSLVADTGEGDLEEAPE